MLVWTSPSPLQAPSKPPPSCAGVGTDRCRRPGSPPSVEITWNFMRQHTQFVVDQTWSRSQPPKPPWNVQEKLTCSLMCQGRERAFGDRGLGLGSPPGRWQQDIQKDTFSQMPLRLLSLLMPGAKMYLPSPACVEIKTPGPWAVRDATSFAALAP